MQRFRRGCEVIGSKSGLSLRETKHIVQMETENTLQLLSSATPWITYSIRVFQRCRLVQITINDFSKFMGHFRGQFQLALFTGVIITKFNSKLNLQRLIIIVISDTSSTLVISTKISISKSLNFLIQGFFLFLYIYFSLNFI